MENVKQQTKNTKQDGVKTKTNVATNETKTEAKQHVHINNATVFRSDLVVGKEFKTRTDLATFILNYLKQNGVTVNNKGRAIDIKHLKQEVSAIIKDINDERGKERGAWWSTLKVEEDRSKAILKIVKRA